MQGRFGLGTPSYRLFGAPLQCTETELKFGLYHFLISMVPIFMIVAIKQPDRYRVVARTD
jgi:hypothetical protein